MHYTARVIKVSGTVGLFAARTFKYERGNAMRSVVSPDEILLIRSGIIDADFNYSELFALIEKSRENLESSHTLGELSSSLDPRSFNA